MNQTSSQNAIDIEILPATEFETVLGDLSAILHGCVQTGASVGFILPFDIKAAENFWRNNIEHGLLSGTKHLLVAKSGQRVVGTVLLDCNTMPNQPHRADVAKLLVHPEFQRRGIARRLMLALE
ncbi:MAG: GNAT family N-acetyltransferase, partial [Kordiimonas sp.]